MPAVMIFSLSYPPHFYKNVGAVALNILQNIYMLKATAPHNSKFLFIISQLQPYPDAKSHLHTAE